MSVRLNGVSVVKILLHASRHSYSIVSGALVGRKGVDNVIVVEDAFPLAHTNVLAPMFEVAMMQIEEYIGKGSQIVGYYCGNELLEDTKPNLITKRIADKIATETPHACLLMIGNRKLGTLSNEVVPFELYSKHGSEWKVSSSSSSSSSSISQQVEITDPTAMDKVAGYISSSTSKGAGNKHQQQQAPSVVDFDTHFDDVSKDWTNSHINKLVDTK
eukprot:TRINITY_DN2712_c0_g1_i1.p1 TRINITY_DN2712_c0_g1~~TRINITY_DN2712_c0_g1_i1.p1  ORF type:complete len:216 (-),score=52.00 TRINITY_DN2712_c0_g1_i1:39-686(-)